MKMKRNTAFYIEALIITLFLLMCSVVLLQIFAVAKKTSDNSKQGSDAVLIAQNASEQFMASLSNNEQPGDAAVKMGGVGINDDFQINYSSQGLPAHDGEYIAILSYDIYENIAGKSYYIDVKIYNQYESDPLFTLQTTRFVNNSL